MFKRLPLYFYPAMVVFFGAAMFFFLYRLSGDSPKVVDMAFLIVSGTMLCLCVVGGLLEGLERQLGKWLEPKTGGAVSVSGNGSGQRNHRRDLEHSFVHSLSSRLHDQGMDGQAIGAFIKAATDSMLGDNYPVAKTPCTCGPGAACNNCPVRHDTAAIREAAVNDFRAGKPYASGQDPMMQAFCSSIERYQSDARLVAANQGLQSFAQRMADKWAGALACANTLADRKAEADSVFGASPHSAHVSGHSVECLYHYALARLGLRDSDDLRVIFWDAHEALHWDEKTDRHQVPALKDSPCPECERNSDSAGAKADQCAEAEIVAAGLTAPRVTADQIQSLIDQLTWRYEHEAGSRHTFAHAFLDDFYIATGHNAPISRENFDATLGQKYAREQAEGKAREKFWGHEGYALAKSLGMLPS